MSDHTPVINPLPVAGTPASVSPNLQMPIPLYWKHDEGINWSKGEAVTKAQLEQAITQSKGQQLPNGILPALDPGDVVVLQDGDFWIDRNWLLQPVDVSDPDQ